MGSADTVAVQGGRYVAGLFQRPLGPGAEFNYREVPELREEECCSRHSTCVTLSLDAVDHMKNYRCMFGSFLFTRVTGSLLSLVAGFIAELRTPVESLQDVHSLLEALRELPSVIWRGRLLMGSGVGYRRQ